MIKTYFKRIVSFFIAAVMLLGILPSFASAAYTPTGDETLSITTRFYRFEETYGSWVETDRAARGEQVKARVYIETNYYAGTGNLMFFYDKSMFSDAYDRDTVYEAQLNENPSSLAATYGFVGDMVIPRDNKNIHIEDMLYDGVISQDFFDKHQCIIFGFYTAGSVECLMMNDETWFVEFDLILREDAEMGMGSFFFEPATVLSPNNLSGYCDVPVGYAGGKTYDTIPFYEINVNIVTENAEIKNYSTVYIDAAGGYFPELQNGTYIEQDIFVLEEMPLYGIQQPIKDRFSFMGYRFNGTDELAQDYVKVLYEDIHLVAHWEEVGYQIVFDFMDGTGRSIIAEYMPGMELLEPEIPEKYGYSFVGWAREPYGEPVAVPTVMPYENLEFYAVWHVNKYEVTFVDEGEVIDTIYVEYGAEIPWPETMPTKMGYLFAGWEYNGETVQDLPNMPAENIVINAVWVPCDDTPYMVEYYIMQPDGNYPEICDYIESHQGVTGDVVSFEAAEREGFSVDTFNSVTEAVIQPDGSTLLKVYYLRNKYTLTVDNGNEVVEYAVYYGEEVVMPEAPEKYGATFDGWFDQNGNRFEYSFIMPAEDVVMTAMFVENEYTATFRANGGRFIDGSGTIVSSYHAGEELGEIPIPERPGYNFAGWDMEIPDKMPDQNITLTALWEAETYRLVFYADYEYITLECKYNEEVFEPPMPEKEGFVFSHWAYEDTHDEVYFPFIMPASDVTLIAVWVTADYPLYVEVDGEIVSETYHRYDSYVDEPQLPEREGYEFVGWYDKYEDTPVTFPFVMPMEEVVLVAKYEILSYSITFDAAGGKFANGNEKLTVNYDYGHFIEAADTPAREGYTFVGWDTEIPRHMPAENITVKALWILNQYTITFDTAGGTAIPAVKQNYGTAVAKPADPVKTGYSFAGWDKEVPSTMPAENITITAKWTVNEYTITFDTAGGTVVAAIKQAYNTAVATPVAPTKTGYTFAGWDKEVPSTMPAENITITAKWTVNQYTVTFKTLSGNTIGSGSYAYGATVAAPQIPEGATLVGWFDENGREAVIPSTMPAKNVVLYAKLRYEFSNNPYDVKAEFDEDCFGYDYKDITFSVVVVEGRREDGGVYFGKKNCSQIGLYNLKFFYGDDEIEPKTGKSVTVSIPVPGNYKEWNSFVVTHRHSPTEWNTFEVPNQNGRIVFTTEEFSEFGIYVVTDTKIKTYPKTNYAYKDSFDVSGLTLEVTNADGTTSVISDTSKMNISGFNPKKIGTQTITVEYAGAVVTYEVRVAYTWWQMLIRIFLLGFLWY